MSECVEGRDNCTDSGPREQHAEPESADDSSVGRATLANFCELDEARFGIDLSELGATSEVVNRFDLAQPQVGFTDGPTARSHTTAGT